MAKLPAFQFYPGDWMKDPALRSCSPAARGVWMDMLCLMFESDRRGFLQAPNGKPFSQEQLARMTGCSSEEVSRLLAELETSGVYSRTRHGIIFSRRLKRDEETRADARFRQNSYRKAKKTNENSDAVVTPDVTAMSHPSSSSSSSSKQSTKSPPAHATPETEPEGVPDGMAPTQYSAWVLEQADILAVPRLVRTLADAITLLAKTEKCTTGEATERMLQRVKMAQGQGTVKWDFWLSDGEWQRQARASPATVGMNWTPVPETEPINLSKHLSAETTRKALEAWRKCGSPRTSLEFYQVEMLDLWKDLVKGLLKENDPRVQEVAKA